MAKLLFCACAIPISNPTKDFSIWLVQSPIRIVYGSDQPSDDIPSVRRASPSTLKLHFRNQARVPQFGRERGDRPVLHEKEDPCTTVNSDAPVGKFPTSALAPGLSAARGARFRTTSRWLHCAKPSTAE